MTVVAELEKESMVFEALKNSKNLRGASILLDKDLSKDSRDKKAVMFNLKKTLSNIDDRKKITVRNERMRVDNDWFYWDFNKKIMSNKIEGNGVLKRIFNKNPAIECL
ncbi:hypothetical protein ACFFRR_005211 [Megaselia abdita]